MPEQETLKRAKKDLQEGKSASTAAGEFVHEEIEHIREGKHGARSAKQAIAIGLSKARRAGIPLKTPKKGAVKEATRKQAIRETKKAQAGEIRKPNPRRSAATEKALQEEPHSAASHRALSAQTRSAAKKRTKTERHDAVMKAVRTKGPVERQQAAKKAAKTRAAKKR